MDRKICSRCGDKKPVNAFAWRNKANGTYQSECRACVSDRDRCEAPSRRKAKLRTNRMGMTRRREETMSKVIEYLQANPCLDCSEDDPLVLDFDHRSDKADNIGRLVSLGYSWESVLEEIKKCDVRCANCHRRKTAREQKTIRWQQCARFSLGRVPA